MAAAERIRIRPAAVLATTKSLRLVDLLRLLLSVAVDFGERLDGALSFLGHGKIKPFEIPEHLIRRPQDQRNATLAEKFRKARLLEAARESTGWRNSFADAERLIRESLLGVDALLSDLGDPGCREVAAHLARHQNLATAFPGYTPCPWEAITARDIASRVLFHLGRHLNPKGKPLPAPPPNDDPEAIAAALTLGKNAVDDVVAILRTEADLDQLEQAIAADRAELGYAADGYDPLADLPSIEPTRLKEKLRELQVLRAEFLAAGAEHPEGEVYWSTDEGVSVSLAGLSAAATARLQNISEHTEPLLRELGADIPEVGKAADGRILRWIIGAMLTGERSEYKEFGSPFGVIATGIQRFIARLAEAPRLPESEHSTRQKSGGGADTKRTLAKKSQPRAPLNQRLLTFVRQNKNAIGKGTPRIEIVRRFCLMNKIPPERAKNLDRNLRRYLKATGKDI